MNAKTKQVSTTEKNTTPEVKAIGPVVAIQYPAKVDYSETEATAKKLAAKYSHLKQLDVDNKDGYSELVAAIADIRTLGLTLKSKRMLLKTLSMILERLSLIYQKKFAAYYKQPKTL